MKWVLFLLSLLALFFANNMLFWVSGNYDWLNFAASGVAISLAAVLAWLSSKRFAGEHASRKELMMTPPAVIWIFVVVLFCCAGLMKLVMYRLAGGSR